MSYVGQAVKRFEDPRLVTGHGTYVEYVSAVVGWDAHSAMERIRVARALVRLPGVFAKLAAAELSWSAVRELTRVVEPKTEKVWLDACANLRVREVQRLVSGRKLGDLPSSPIDEGARLHPLRYEVTGTTLALVRQAEAPPVTVSDGRAPRSAVTGCARSRSLRTTGR